MCCHVPLSLQQNSSSIQRSLFILHHRCMHACIKQVIDNQTHTIKQPTIQGACFIVYVGVYVIKVSILLSM